MTKLIAPTGKAILKMDTPEETFSNGLVVPDSAKKNSTRAIVVDSKIPDVEAGDRVVTSGEYAGASFSIDGEEYVVVVAEELLAVIG